MRIRSDAGSSGATTVDAILNDLRSIGSREDLDSMFDQARTNCMAAGNAVRPVVFEGMFMAIAFSHEKRLASLAKGIEELRIEL
jgi:hypothetical protein